MIYNNSVVATAARWIGLLELINYPIQALLAILILQPEALNIKVQHKDDYLPWAVQQAPKAPAHLANKEENLTL